jgi:intracellular septation protein
MKDLFQAGKFLLLDMASTIVFLVVFLAIDNIRLSVMLGVAFGVAQIGWELLRRRPIDVMQWLSLVLVVGSGAAALLTDNPRYVMLKPTLIYALVGAVMLRKGWMNRYLPPIATTVVPDVAVVFGFVWSALMFFSSALNIVIALNFSVAAWASIMSVYGLLSKLALFLVQYAVMRFMGVRRRRATLVLAHDSPTAPVTD